MTDTGPNVLDLRDIVKTFQVPGTREHRTVVDHVSLSVGHAETVALVGESGSGKSTLARIALRLIRPDAGGVMLLGEDLLRLRGSRLRELRVKSQPIFQDPVASFNPRRRVWSALSQALEAQGVQGDAAESQARELLELVGLRPSSAYLPRWPHELSGGQRQRLAIARALAMDPALLIADEPLTGADVSIRGQILNLLLDLQQRTGIGILFITHDISLAKSFATRVAVMKNGSIVEEGATNDVLTEPQHEYTRRLLQAMLTV